jgi:hypothetical protein
MLTIKECREKLQNTTYSDEEILAIRDFLYKLAKLNVQYIKETLKENGQKGNLVHTGLNG